MAWVRLDDQFAEHPKMQAAGPLGRDLQVAALCYCNRNLTDGYVPKATARRLADTDDIPGVTAQTIIARLIDVGAWIEVPGGYRIHDYADYQPTRDQVIAEREQKREAGRLGGLAAARTRRAKKADAQPPGTADAQAGATASAQAGALAESKPVPVTGPNPLNPPLPPPVPQASDEPPAAPGRPAPPKPNPPTATAVLDRITNAAPPAIATSLRAGINGQHHQLIVEALGRGWTPADLADKLAGWENVRSPPGALLARLRGLGPPPADHTPPPPPPGFRAEDRAAPEVAAPHIDAIRRQLADDQEHDP